MKTVFSNSKMVAHVWAQQSQNEGHNSNRSLYFKDGTIYNDMLVISVTVYDKHGEEVYRDSLGGCDYEYVTSGNAFFENAMFESCKEEAQKDFATVTPQAIPQNYTHGAFI